MAGVELVGVAIADAKIAIPKVISEFNSKVLAAFNTMPVAAMEHKTGTRLHPFHYQLWYLIGFAAKKYI